MANCVEALCFVSSLMFISSSNGFLIRENVVYDKTNEVHVINGRWLVVFVHDLKPYLSFIDKVKQGITFINGIMQMELLFYQRSNLTGYWEAMKSLQI